MVLVQPHLRGHVGKGNSPVPDPLASGGHYGTVYHRSNQGSNGSLSMNFLLVYSGPTEASSQTRITYYNTHPHPST